MPGIERFSINEVVAEATELQAAGIGAVLLFGIPAEKDEAGSSAYDERGRRADGGAGAEGGASGAARDHRRLPLRVHLARPLRVRPRRRGRQRHHARAARADRDLARRGRRRRRRPERHDGRPGRRDPPPARRGGAPEHGDHRLLGEVRLGVLRPVPRGGRVGARVRRPPRLPDGPGQRARGAARGRARRRGGRRHGDGEAGAALPRPGPPGPRGDRRAGRRLPGLGRVLDAEGGGRRTAGSTSARRCSSR